MKTKEHVEGAGFSEKVVKRAKQGSSEAENESLVNNLSATVVDLASMLTTGPVFSGSADGD